MAKSLQKYFLVDFASCPAGGRREASYLCAQLPKQRSLAGKVASLEFFDSHTHCRQFLPTRRQQRCDLPCGDDPPALPILIDLDLDLGEDLLESVRPALRRAMRTGLLLTDVLQGHPAAPGREHRYLQQFLGLDEGHNRTMTCSVTLR